MTTISIFRSLGCGSIRFECGHHREKSLIKCFDGDGDGDHGDCDYYRFAFDFFLTF